MKKVCLGLVLLLSGIFMTANAKVQCSYDTFEGYKACRALFDEMMNLPVPQSDNIRELNEATFKILEPLYIQRDAKMKALNRLNAKSDAKQQQIDNLRKEVRQLNVEIRSTIDSQNTKIGNLLLPMQRLKYKTEVKDKIKDMGRNYK